MFWVNGVLLFWSDLEFRDFCEFDRFEFEFIFDTRLYWLVSRFFSCFWLKFAESWSTSILDLWINVARPSRTLLRALGIRCYYLVTCLLMNFLLLGPAPWLLGRLILDLLDLRKSVVGGMRLDTLPMPTLHSCDKTSWWLSWLLSIAMVNWLFPPLYCWLLGLWLWGAIWKSILGFSLERSYSSFLGGSMREVWWCG